MQDIGAVLVLVNTNTNHPDLTVFRKLEGSVV